MSWKLRWRGIWRSWVIYSQEIQQHKAAFDLIVHRLDDLDIEYCLARELMTLLGYDRWENFSKALERAKISCKNSKLEISDHFRDVTKMVTIRSDAERHVADIMLTRYACYLAAQNADTRKRAVAFVQTYFAVQTRKQKLLEERVALQRRLDARKNFVNPKRSYP